MSEHPRTSMVWCAWEIKQHFHKQKGWGTARIRHCWDRFTPTSPSQTFGHLDTPIYIGLADIIILAFFYSTREEPTISLKEPLPAQTIESERRGDIFHRPKESVHQYGSVASRCHHHSSFPPTFGLGSTSGPVLSLNSCPITIFSQH